ncbi:hypothetical protein DFJ77DRAFT_244279 [Powellomyces hirtus]|nr:hypothetical protein DFJ77DRAFT_244279 [Powellomyces hirtus]
MMTLMTAAEARRPSRQAIFLQQPRRPCAVAAVADSAVAAIAVVVVAVVVLVVVLVVVIAAKATTTAHYHSPPQSTVVPHRQHRPRRGPDRARLRELRRVHVGCVYCSEVGGPGVFDSRSLHPHRSHRSRRPCSPVSHLIRLHGRSRRLILGLQSPGEQALFDHRRSYPCLLLLQLWRLLDRTAMNQQADFLW